MQRKVVADIKTTRINKLQEILIEHEIDCALILYHRDVYYYAGSARPASLAVTPDDAVLFARRGTSWIVSESSVRDIREGGLTSISAWMKDKGLQKGKIGTEMDIVPANLYLRMREGFPGARFTDISPFILGQRLVKDEEEIESIKGACRIVEAAHRRLPEILKKGMTEFDLAAELARIARLHGHETFAIPRKRMETEMPYVHLLSGESTKIMGGYGQVVTGSGLSAAFPYGPSKREIKTGDVVVLDIAGMNGGYHSDMARTFCIGKAAPEILEAHSTLVSIQTAMLEEARPGNTASGLYETAIGRAGELGWSDYFQGRKNRKDTFAGHGLGLEVDEPPFIGPKEETVLKKNMTFTTELFIVHPDFGEVKLEDTLLLTDDGPQFLTILERKVTEVQEF